MALVSCRECGEQVSTDASECPHCGVPNPSRENDASEVDIGEAVDNLGEGCQHLGCALMMVPLVIVILLGFCA